MKCLLGLAYYIFNFILLQLFYMYIFFRRALHAHRRCTVFSQPCGSALIFGGVLRRCSRGLLSELTFLLLDQGVQPMESFSIPLIPLVKVRSQLIPKVGPLSLAKPRFETGRRNCCRWSLGYWPAGTSLIPTRVV